MAKNKMQSFSTNHAFHQITIDEVVNLRSDLLKWYDVHRRNLPWRRDAGKIDVDDRAYAVLVSEVMLQQTRVDTVKQYYEKWLSKWSTAHDLSTATLEEVYKMWTGLGYYARAKRLYEAVKEVVEKHGGKFPKSSTQLQKLPGIGRYTAGAVASISFGEKIGAVDGNVIRVLTRLRCIGACTSSKAVTEEIWTLANEIVDESRPGDFNQALMEIGSSVCTPKVANCRLCPLKNACLAHKTFGDEKLKHHSEIQDIETVPECVLCPTNSDKIDVRLGALNYPQKAKKPLPNKQHVLVCVVYQLKGEEHEYFVVKRPRTGLLANMWEFPNIVLQELVTGRESLQFKKMQRKLKDCYNLDPDNVTYHNYCGNSIHMFSHIHQTNVIFGVEIEEQDEMKAPTGHQGYQWLTDNELKDCALSTCMLNVYKMFTSKVNSCILAHPTRDKRKRSAQE